MDESGQAGQFILTGSQNFELLETVSQSLAGRTALAKLLPFSLEEIGRISEPPNSIDELLYNGAYPRIYDHNLNPTEALSFYFSTYVERDLRQMIKDVGASNNPKPGMLLFVTEDGNQKPDTRIVQKKLACNVTH